MEEKYELESILYDIATITSIRIGEKPIEFFVELASDLPRCLIGDMGRVKQVLINMIGNAVKFTEKGYIYLVINGEKTETDWMIQIEVRDTGIGIKQEDLSELFESFNQVDTRRNRNIEGTGLGLAISKNLCEIIMVAEGLMAPYKMKIKHALSGMEAINSVQKHAYDMVLMDYMMPGMDGYETLKYIRGNELWKEIPVIFLTAQQDIASEREGFRIGANDFIVKPFDNIVMLARVHSQLELYQYQTELKHIINTKTLEIESLQHVITVSWAEIIESRDGTTGSHVRNTTLYFKELFGILQNMPLYREAISEYNMNDLLRASSLHDIGKVGISDLILKKPGALSIREFDMMKLHTKIGADMISKIIDHTNPDPFLLYARDMAFFHHERWDGMGYPSGLKGNEIPLYVQILSIADVFEALTAVRPYKRAFTFDEALEIMSGDRGKFYNPELFDVFYSQRDKIHAILDLRNQSIS